MMQPPFLQTRTPVSQEVPWVYWGPLQSQSNSCRGAWWFHSLRLLRLRKGPCSKPVSSNLGLVKGPYWFLLLHLTFVHSRWLTNQKLLYNIKCSNSFVNSCLGTSCRRASSLMVFRKSLADSMGRPFLVRRISWAVLSMASGKRMNLPSGFCVLPWRCFALCRSRTRLDLTDQFIDRRTSEPSIRPNPSFFQCLPIEL